MLREAAATPDQMRDCSALRRTWERTLGCTTLPRAVEVLAALVPAALLHAVDRDVPRPAERRQEQVLAQHAVLLAPDQDLAGEEQHVGLPAVLRDELRHGGLGALDHGEGAARAALVQRQDVE